MKKNVKNFIHEDECEDIKYQEASEKNIFKHSKRKNQVQRYFI